MGEVDTDRLAGQDRDGRGGIVVRGDDPVTLSVAPLMLTQSTLRGTPCRVPSLVGPASLPRRQRRGIERAAAAVVGAGVDVEPEEVVNAASPSSPYTDS